ncbi:Quercetin 2,3-dioxygenase [Nocardioides dokdonensis FR1436]|uniref:Quercetin 2,3-dioxygenase n=1 Tax=Nocardioides dokdonensis FR1436 TaxID=1300347 RepID=A0A1A9GHX4_9ACTN|nr:pirin family protein [Nocardioides dokdonensis]ANH37203.1 Quercetin 2,3-dioxygenase [Nocardioides dokdonensis FR1436]
MSNPDPDPTEIDCEQGPLTGTVEVLPARDVPLGGPRAMLVRRTLPQRSRSLIGAWCFLDHYGPDDVAVTGGMSVAPHPHTGLQTVSWLFTGEIEHRDSVGSHAMVRPGELGLMTAGRGISHSEISTAGTTTLHGAQLWVALPDATRHCDPGFEYHAPTPLTGPGWEVRVFLGTLLGTTSPVRTHTPLLGAEVLLEPGTSLSLDVDTAHEHGVLVDLGPVVVDGVEVDRCELAYVPPGGDVLTLVAGADGARLLVLGGEPFGESIVMWWNFVGRSHEEVVAFRQEWQDQVEHDGAVVSDAQQVAPGRFGVVAGDHLPPIPAPPLPNARLRERG